MNFPTPPMRPYANAWGNAGRAVSTLGQGVQDFGNEQEKLRAAYQDMVAKRQEKILADERAAREMQLREETAARAREEADRVAKQRESEGAVRGQIRGRLGTAGFGRAQEAGLYAEAGLEPPARFYSPEPEKPAAPVNWQNVHTEDGLYQTNPRTGERRVVEGVPGKPPPRDNTLDAAQLGRQKRLVQARLDAMGPRPKGTFDPAGQTWDRTRGALEKALLDIELREASLAQPEAPAAPQWPVLQTMPPLMPQVTPPGGPRPTATGEDGQKIEWDGTAWIPAR